MREIKKSRMADCSNTKGSKLFRKYHLPAGFHNETAAPPPPTPRQAQELKKQNKRKHHHQNKTTESLSCQGEQHEEKNQDQLSLIQFYCNGFIQRFYTEYDISTFCKCTYSSTNVYNFQITCKHLDR